MHKGIISNSLEKFCVYQLICKNHKTFPPQVIYDVWVCALPISLNCLYLLLNSIVKNTFTIGTLLLFLLYKVATVGKLIWRRLCTLHTTYSQKLMYTWFKWYLISRHSSLTWWHECSCHDTSMHACDMHIRMHSQTQCLWWVTYVYMYKHLMKLFD